ncbi:jg26184, partial [Pararge aegeria aegeria]
RDVPQALWRYGMSYAPFGPPHRKLHRTVLLYSIDDGVSSSSSIAYNSPLLD